MAYIWQYIKPVMLAGALTLVTTGACQGQIVLGPTVTLNNGLYHYDYTITNNSPTDDLFDVTIHVNPAPDAVQNLVTPGGFQSAFDSGLGLVDFLEDSNNFTGTPLSGFGFDSKFSPASGVFDANFLSTGTAAIFTLSGPTLTPTGPVPEPGSGTWFVTAAMAISGVCFTRWIRGRRLRSATIRQGG